MVSIEPEIVMTDIKNKRKKYIIHCKTDTSTRLKSKIFTADSFNSYYFI